MLLIAFGSKARQGKDTAAEAVKDYFDQKIARSVEYFGKPNPKLPVVKIFKFAAALYEECRTQHGMTTKDAPLLQRIGQARRQEDPLYWVKICYSKIISDPQMKGGIAIISDLRYQNEAEFVKSHGGVLVNVKRLNSDGTQYIASDRDPNHSSEVDLDGYNWDYQIVSKDAALTGEMAITIVGFLRGLQ